MSDRHRIDAWLKLACLFKHRSEAAAACRGGKVKIDGQRVKPAAAVKPGDVIEFMHGTHYRRVVVQDLPAGPVSKEVARTMYVDETPKQDRDVLPAKAVYRVVPERTFKRRLAKRETLKPSEADAVARLLRVTEIANRTFGDAAFARKFLSLPNPALGDRIPNELAETDAGAREVEVILGRIAHGVYS